MISPVLALLRQCCMVECYAPVNVLLLDQLFLGLQAMAACSEMRPSVDISVGGDDSSVGVGAGGARTEYRSTVATAAV